MRHPYPFKVPVDPDSEDVNIKIMVDMPVPYNLTVHIANEHKINPAPYEHQRVIDHMLAHVYGRFRTGAEHYHTEEQA